MRDSYIPPGHMTARQAADALGVQLGGVRQLVRRGQLHRVGGTDRYPYYATPDVLRLLATRRATERPALTRRSEPCNDLRAELCPQAG
ncbi:hypothetical protein [Streptomyces sp. DW26H14]|uniref:hypothetical protein n=1 Tax=Streptomyces sp. DW26H14 TaxID=3435395 RepID=UPI00403DA211